MNATDLLCNDRAAWLEARRTCITATDIAAIVGLNHWSSPLSVWRDYESNIIKYILRHREKNGLEDLKKARTYLDRLIAQEEAKQK